MIGIITVNGSDDCLSGNYDCLGVCDGIAILDECGVCRQIGFQKMFVQQALKNTYFKSGTHLIFWNELLEIPNQKRKQTSQDCLLAKNFQYLAEFSVGCSIRDRMKITKKRVVVVKNYLE